jgi:hypothetical protein
MSGTSEFGFKVTLSSHDNGTPSDPVSAIFARAVQNNVCHLSDEFAQARVAWRGALSPIAGVVPTNTLLFSQQFPVTQRQSGDSYKFRIRLAGSSAVTTDTATIRAVLGLPGVTGTRGSWAVAGVNADAHFLATVHNSTSAWATGVSQGPAASATMIYMPSGIIRPRSFATKLIAGGDASSVDVPFAQLSVYVTSPNANDVTLTGVYLAEYVG